MMVFLAGTWHGLCRINCKRWILNLAVIQVQRVKFLDDLFELDRRANSEVDGI